MKMKPEIRARWVSELRSGKYTQGRHVLRSNKNEYCCLGVLCEIAREDGVDLRLGEYQHSGTNIGSPVVAVTYNGVYDVLPPDVARWAELKDSSGNINLNPSVYDPELEDVLLAGANDRGTDFNQIADLIERDRDAESDAGA